jgi:hypothetical protein
MIRKIKINTQVYGVQDSGNVVFRDSKTVGYIFCNTGNCVIQLNNFPLYPNGVFKTYEVDAIDLTQWRMLFQIQPSDACAPAAELTVLIYSEV